RSCILHVTLKLLGSPHIPRAYFSSAPRRQSSSLAPSTTSHFESFRILHRSMRFLKYNKSGLIGLTDDLADDEIPPYAILSHTWGKPEEEVRVEDFSKNVADSKAGYEKVRFCGEQAVRDGLGYFWMDTCCIDQSSSAEVSMAVNSMFRWYHNAERRYVYLSD